MLLSTRELVGYVLSAQDGEIGRCKDFLFDDEKWAIRYMVADTGSWLSKQRVLVSPVAIESVDSESKRLHVRLQRRQIEEAPRLDEDAPVSRQFERQYSRYYGYEPYWRGPNLWGMTQFPVYQDKEIVEDEKELNEPHGDPHLRSVDEVIGYHIQAKDGEFGHVEDIILDPECWRVQYLIIDTRNWFPSPKVIVPPDWIDAVEWSDSTVKMPLTKEQVKSAPEYDPRAAVDRGYETRLYDYYGRPYYW